MAKSVLDKISIRIAVSEQWIKKNTETFFTFYFKNNSFIPVLNCMIKFKIENRFYPNDDENLLSLTVPANGEYSCKLPIKPIYCGMVNISVSSIEIRDFLNIFSFKKQLSNVSYYFCVLPEKTDSVFSLSPSELYSEDSLIQVKNVNGTQIDGIRNYNYGDRLRNIHWKLSAKHNDFLVKEYSDNNEETAILLIELYAPAIDNIIDNCYGIGCEFLNRNIPFVLAFASSGSEQLSKHFITNRDMFLDSLKQVYLSIASESNTTSLTALKREYAGNGIVYIYGNNNKAVTDII